MSRAQHTPATLTAKATSPEVLVVEAVCAVRVTLQAAALATLVLPPGPVIVAPPTKRKKR